MQKTLADLLTNEDGAVTVDWVVLTAAIVGLGISVIAFIGVGADSMGDKVGASLTNGSVLELNFPKF